MFHNGISFKHLQIIAVDIPILNGRGDITTIAIKDEGKTRKCIYFSVALQCVCWIVRRQEV